MTREELITILNNKEIKENVFSFLRNNHEISNLVDRVLQGKSIAAKEEAQVQLYETLVNEFLKEKKRLADRKK